MGTTESGDPITLSRGFIQNYSLATSGPTSATFHFDMAIEGAHLRAPDEALLGELCTRAPALDQWLGISGLKVEQVRPQKEVRIHFSEPEDLEFDLEPGLALVLDFDWIGPRPCRPQLQASLEQHVWLVLKASPPRPLSELRTTLRRLENLFTLLIGQPPHLETVTARRPDSRRDPGRLAPNNRLFIHLPEAGREPDRTEVPAHRMLLDYQRAIAVTPDLFRRWLQSYELLEPSYNAYFALERQDPGYQELRFLGLLQALESLHRRTSPREPSPEHRERVERLLKHPDLSAKDRKLLKRGLRNLHEPALLDRLKEMMDPFGELFGSKEQRKRLLERAAATRNYLTHYDAALRERAVEPSKLLPYLSRFKVLFVLQCLCQLGLTPDEAGKLIEENHRLSQWARFGEI